MNTSPVIDKKNKYFTPTIINVKLDSEISLQMQSEPPIGPDEDPFMPGAQNTTDSFFTSIDEI